MSTKEFQVYKERQLVRTKDPKVYNPVNYLYYVDFLGNWLSNVKKSEEKEDTGILNFFKEKLPAPDQNIECMVQSYNIL